ncbi:MAG: putative type II secretion system protein F [Candidatus Anoxychlamydiales bacterium]|nr:putative type II secretion system protein F [Candidatus Anoxychlamydiales bacterium]
MAIFEYKAIMKNGKISKDVIFANDINEAKFFLFKDDLKILSLKKNTSRYPQLSKKEILNFTKDLLRLLKASIPLYEALIILSKNSSKKLRYITLDLLQSIKKGLYLSQALLNHKKNFDEIYISIIKASEKIGKLEYSLEEMIKLLEKEIKIKKKIISSFTYPSLLLSFCFIVLTVLFFYIIPSLSDLFDQRSVHPFTKFILAISNFFYYNKTFFFFFFFFIKILISSLLIFKFIRKKIFNFIMSLPILKKFMIKIFIERFCKTFGALLYGGVSYIEAYNLSINTILYPKLKEKLKTSKNLIEKGYSLSSVLEEIKIIPSMVPKMIKLSEKSGKLEEMLFSISSIYEEEIDRKLTTLTTLLQPIILVILGFIIGFVILSVLLPLTDISSFIGD